MNVDVVKRRFARKFDARHNHAAHPKEDDVVGGDERARRVKLCKIVGLLRPAERAERPQPRRKPRVEYVGILFEFGRRTLRTDVHVFARNDRLPAFFAVPHRNAVTPPQLTADAPVADIFEPYFIRVFPFAREKFDIAVFPRTERFLCKRLHFDKPLIAQIRFDDGIAAIAMSDRVRDLFFTLE